MAEPGKVRKPIVVAPGQGRAYAMGPMRAIFKADGDETADLYSVSEWRMEPATRGPGVHWHPEDHIFYILAGTLSLRVDDNWSHLDEGGYVIIPGGTPHDFENRQTAPVRFISFTSPGGFEAEMAGIAAEMAARDLQI
jgi:mannose-6-phosphate isomerase-like protein (cupin superfamily)